MGFRCIVSLLAAAGGLLVGAAPVRAADVLPDCRDARSVARVGSVRHFVLHCERTDAVRLTRPPAHGTLSGPAYATWSSAISFSFRPAAGAPDRDDFVLELTGPGGRKDLTVPLEIVPPGVNTPPTCRPDGRQLRTDGASPVEVDVQDQCQDAEQDAMRFGGDGPGTWLRFGRDVPAGTADTGREWARYRTAATQGTETARIWATDELGARSEPAPVALAFGPRVDRLPTCLSEYVRARPGVPRRFSLQCSDPDGDPFEIGVADPPTRGTLTRFDVGFSRLDAWGRSAFVDVVHTPASAFTGQDTFTVVPRGARGDGAPARVTVHAQAPPANTPGECHADRPAETQQNQPIEVRLGCTDLDGDLLAASVVVPPRQGTVSRPVTAGAPGDDRQDVRFTWTPDPEDEGRDVVVLSVTDGHGEHREVTQELRAFGPSYLRLPPPTTFPGLLPPPAPGPAPFPATPAPVPSPGAGGGAAAAPSPADQARAALGTADVRLLRRVGTARAYVPAAAVGRGLAARARLRPVAVACPVACAVRAESWTSGSPRRREQLAAAPGRARALSLHLSAAQRRAIRRARGDAATFRITVIPQGARPATGRMAVRLRP